MPCSALTVPPPPSILLLVLVGYIMLGTMLLCMPFAMHYPRQLKMLRDTAVGRFLNDFRWFWGSHIFMFFVFFAALICHPWPKLPTVRWPPP